MSPAPQRIPFHFHAEGHAFSGEFRHPGRHIIPAQASTSLPTIGGHAHAHADHFHVEDFASFRTAHTEVSGRKIDENTLKTHATTIIQDLNVLDVVTADRIVLRLTSIHNPKDPEGRITADGSEFQNLRVAGHEVKVILRHKLLVDCPYFSDIAKQVAKEKKSGRIAKQNDRVVICSLVEKIETDLPGVDPRQHVFTVPNFGKIALAEIFAEPGTRTVTMLRLELGSPHIADLSAAEARIDGQPPPPG